MSEPTIDSARLAQWMDEAALPGKGLLLDTRFLSGGTQNVIYELTRGDESCVFRLPPRGRPRAAIRGS